MGSDSRTQKPSDDNEGKEYTQKGMREEKQKVKGRKTQKFGSRILPSNDKM